MIGTSTLELVIIRILIFYLQYIVPLCVLAAALLWHALFRSTAAPLGLVGIVAGLVVLELCYAVLIYRPFQARLRASAIHPPALTTEERSRLFERCLANVSDLDRYLRLWFLGADPDEIKRENVKDFILWAFFDREPAAAVSAEGVPLQAAEVADRSEDTGFASSGEEDADAEQEQERELENYVCRIEQLLGRPLPPGRGTAVPLRLTFDSIATRYRSFVWYVIVWLVDSFTSCQLVWHGFRPRTTPWRSALRVIPWRLQALVPSPPACRSPSAKLGYWYRPHTSKTSLPVVFFHGIGIGIYPYVAFLANIPPETGVIALEMLSISMRLYVEPLSRPDFLREVERIVVSHHGWDRFVLVSHSYGSVLTTHVLRSPVLAPKVAAVVLIDPVSLCLHLPDVAYNFTRRPPRRANEWLLWYFASMDPGTALTLGRHFFWKENQIWKEELVSGPGKDSNGPASQRKVAVVLSGRDLIVDTRSVARYLLCDGDLNSTPQQAGDALLEQLVSGSGSTASTAGSKSSAGQAQRGRSLTKDGITVWWFPKLDHSEVFENAKDRSQIQDVVTTYCMLPIA